MYIVCICIVYLKILCGHIEHPKLYVCVCVGGVGGWYTQGSEVDIYYVHSCVYTLRTPSFFVYTYYIHSCYISAVSLGGCLASSISLLNHRTPIVKSVPINQVTPIY